MAVAAAAAAWRSQDGWGTAGAAALAVTFAWASIASSGGWSRWRRALAGHAFPPSVARVATWAVPGTEALVPALALSGRPRAAAAVALAAVVVFSAALVRLALRDGVRVSCGCFGRGSIDVRVALGRNAVLAAAAIASWMSAPPDPRLQLPRTDDSLPALLLAGALAVSVITGWRAAVWLRKGSV